jgi:hypothetical protein
LQDPLADGVVIHTAATRALQHGTTLDRVIDMVAKVSPELKAPLVLFTYYNPIIRKGMDKFCAQIKAAGASGEAEGTRLHIAQQLRVQFAEHCLHGQLMQAACAVVTINY